jgi:hypothetical protein
VLVKLASSEASQLRDLHADMDRQISHTNQLRLVDCCYDPLVLTNLYAVAKSNVVTGYTLSSQVGSRGSGSRGMIISHGFVKKMEFLSDGEDVDHLVHNHNNKKSCWSRDLQGICNSLQSLDGLFRPPWFECSTSLFMSW